MIKKICPADSSHNEFITTAHEVHDWVVDSMGNFIKDLGCLDVSAKPDSGNEWTCRTCGASAVGGAA